MKLEKTGLGLRGYGGPFLTIILKNGKSRELRTYRRLVGESNQEIVSCCAMCAYVRARGLDA